MSKPSGAWQRKFVAALAETSNVAGAARKAEVSASAAYEARRKNRAFADNWQAALAEGYDNLEIELLRRLREGELKPAAGATPPTLTTILSARGRVIGRTCGSSTLP